MVPTINRLTLAMKKLIDDDLNAGEVKMEMTPYISKATLDVLGLVGKK
jgi:hypothetical protein